MAGKGLNEAEGKTVEQTAINLKRDPGTIAKYIVSPRKTVRKF